MARAHYVKNSRKPHQCKGGHEIPAGEGYYWAAPGFRTSKHGKKFACSAHPFRESELTSGLRSEPLAARVALNVALDAVTDIEGIEGAWQDFVSELESYQSQRQEALDAWENGNSQLEDLVYTADAAVDEATSWEPEEFSEDEPERDDYDSDEEYDEAVAEWESNRDEHFNEQVEAARDLADGLEF